MGDEVLREDKAGLVRELGELLYKFGVEDVLQLKYNKTESESGAISEIVTVYFCSGGDISVNVSMDSKATIIRDIMKSLQ